MAKSGVGLALEAAGSLHPAKRKEACRRIGIKPWSVTLENGQDPVAFILSANITRRHLSKGQQAMVVAKALLLSNTSQKKAAEKTGINRTRIVPSCTCHRIRV
jgi:hypothetical protein